MGGDLKAKFLQVYSVLKSELLNDSAFEFTPDSRQWVDRVSPFISPLMFLLSIYMYMYIHTYIRICSLYIRTMHFVTLFYFRIYQSPTRMLCVCPYISSPFDFYTYFFTCTLFLISSIFVPKICWLLAGSNLLRLISIYAYDTIIVMASFTWF